MAKKWTEVVQSPEYNAMPASEKANAQRQYFVEVIAPQVPKEERGVAISEFYQQFPAPSDPTEGQSFVENAWQNFGGTLPRTWQRIKQIGYGSPDFSDVSGTTVDYTGQTISTQSTPRQQASQAERQQKIDELQSEIDETKRLEAPLNATAGGFTGRLIGDIGLVAPAMAAPGVNTVAGAGAIGSLLGFLQPVASDESGLSNVVVGGLGSAGTSALLKVLGKLLMPSLKQSEATKKILQALRRDKIRPDELAQRLNELGPDAMLADVGGENLRALARSTASLPGPGKEIAASSLTARQAGQSGRVSSQISKSIGAGELFYQNVDDLIAARTKNVPRIYKKTVNPKNIIPEEKFRPIAEDADLMDLIRKVKSKPFQGLADLPENSMPVLDATKKHLDDMINVAKRAGENNNVRVLTGVKNKILDIADDAFPSYKAARDAFAGPTQLIDMLEQGRKFLKGDAEMTAKAISKLSDSERDFLLIGVARELRDLVLNTPDTADSVKKLMNTPLIRDKLKVVFPNMKSFRDFEKVMEREARFFATKSAMLSGSRTAPLQAEMADTLGEVASWGSIGKDLLNMDFATAGLRTAAKLSKPRALAPEVSEELGRSIFGQGGDAARVIFKLGEQPKQLPQRLLSTGDFVRRASSVGVPAYSLSQN